MPIALSRPIASISRLRCLILASQPLPQPYRRRQFYRRPAGFASALRISDVSVIDWRYASRCRDARTQGALSHAPWAARHYWQE